MRIRSRLLWAPKAGNAVEDYEDWGWPQRPVDRVARTFRCAVADGATETSFSALWARLLVRAYCAGRMEGRRIPATLAEVRRVWLAEVGTKPLPWYAEEKMRSGAYSSLAGLTLTGDVGGGAWRAWAVGDSCVFHLRGEELRAAFPLATADAFNSRPHLLSSRAGGEEAPATLEGTWEAGDRFLLATDAVAAWALGEHEAAHLPWTALWELSARGWTPWLSGVRDGGTMRNDDVTLLRVQVE